MAHCSGIFRHLKKWVAGSIRWGSLRYTDTTISIGFSRPFPCNIIYADVMTPMLGVDFLRQSGLLLDVANKRLIDPKSFSSVLASGSSIRLLGLASVQEESCWLKLLNQFPGLTTPTFNNKKTDTPGETLYYY